MHEGDEVAEECRWHGEGPDDVLLVPPIVDVDDLLDAALPRRRCRRRRFRHERPKAEGAHRQRGDHARQEPQRVGQLEETINSVELVEILEMQHV